MANKAKTGWDRYGLAKFIQRKKVNNYRHLQHCRNVALDEFLDRLHGYIMFKSINRSAQKRA